MKDKNDTGIILDREYGQISLRWQPDEAQTAVIELQGFDNEKWQVLWTDQLTEEYRQFQQQVAYICQEKGFCSQMRICVSNGQKQILSETFDPEDFFPRQTELLFGSDIAVKDITGYSYSGSGTTAESCFSYYLFHDDEETTLSADYYDEQGNHHQLEKTISEQQFARLQEMLSQGRVVRGQVDDPQLIMLDGFDSHRVIYWKGSSEIQQKYYVYEPAEGFEEYLLSLAG